ncbi:hypothetical protein [Lacisediminihabitans sp.]|uniref:hypothetical protein n=1 Tax=Lacisediminihabitans sp. TaxID=2787631 RepID=UPI00374CAA02
MPERRALALAAAVGVAIALAGCTPTAAPPSGSPSPSPSSSTVAASPLRPVFPDPFDATSAAKESSRIGDAIEATVPTASIVYVDKHDQLVAATAKAPSYFGVLRAITLSPSLDPVATAGSIVTKLKAAGWMQLSSKDTGGVHLVTLSSGTLAGESWFAVVSGDPSTAGQSVVVVQLASPDLP